MKKILLSVSIVAILAACSSKQPASETNTQLLLPPQNAYQNNAMTDTAAAAQPAAEPKVAAQAPRIIEKQTIIYRDAPRKKTQKPVLEAAPQETPPVASTNTPPAPADNGDNGSAENGSGDGSADAETTTKKKEGISKAAKGAIIGGVGGAVAGAVIGKNGKGAVIGAVVGAAGGYILGRKQDKKDGRIDISNQ
ncbi:MAG: YMGG-like glycine zipper-containing protein [Ferruginibacter sp.]